MYAQGGGALGEVVLQDLQGIARTVPPGPIGLSKADSVLEVLHEVVGETARAEKGLGGVEAVGTGASEAAAFLQLFDTVFELALRQVVPVDAGSVQVPGRKACYDDGPVAGILVSEEPLALGLFPLWDTVPDGNELAFGFLAQQLDPG